MDGGAAVLGGPLNPGLACGNPPFHSGASPESVSAFGRSPWVSWTISTPDILTPEPVVEEIGLNRRANADPALRDDHFWTRCSKPESWRANFRRASETSACGAFRSPVRSRAPLVSKKRKPPPRNTHLTISANTPLPTSLADRKHAHYRRTRGTRPNASASRMVLSNEPAFCGREHKKVIQRARSAAPYLPEATGLRRGASSPRKRTCASRASRAP